MPIFSFSRRPNVLQLKSRGDVDGLIEALGYQDDHNIRLAAATALGRIGDSRAVDPLVSALEDQPRVREVAAMALGEIGDHRAVDSLIVALEDADWEIRSTIAKALGKIGDPRAAKSLVNLLGDKSENVRWYASQALEAITGESFGEDITQWEQTIIQSN
jgi:HEAT repeat protein